MKRILVPTDFSGCANNAVNFAVQTAKILPVEVAILHAFKTKGKIHLNYMGVNEELNERANKLSQLKLSIEETEGVVVTTYIFTDTLMGAILKVSEDKNVDLVVMGTLGESGIKQKVWGSNTSAIIGNSKVPVIVIPYEYEWKKPKNILIATNHFEKEPAILNFLFELANLYKAKMQVAVFTNEDDDNTITLLEHTRKTEEYEKMLKKKYKEEMLTATHLVGKEFEVTLEDYIGQNKIDILAMVTYQRSLWARISHPSKTKQMSYHTKIPLLAIPAK